MEYRALCRNGTALVLFKSQFGFECISALGFLLIKAFMLFSLWVLCLVEIAFEAEKMPVSAELYFYDLHLARICFETVSVALCGSIGMRLFKVCAETASVQLK